MNSLPLLVLMAGMSWAQVAWKDAPLSLRLYPRAKGADTASVVISGTVNKTGAPYSEIRVRMYRNAVLQSTLSQSLSFSGDMASFRIATNIKAELAYYKFEMIGFADAKETLLRTADSVVAGEVIVIQGQSNAESCKRTTESANSNRNPFIRVFGSGNDIPPLDLQWHLGDGDVCSQGTGGTGQWGLRLARDIVDQEKLPVAIFNGAKGAMNANYFMWNLANHEDVQTNFGRMLQRLKLSGCASGARVLLWHQGEKNAQEGRYTWEYMSSFDTLRTQWRTDIPALEKIYVFQIRNGCAVPKDQVVHIKEAERLLAIQYDDVEIMSTSAQTHMIDSCHFGYKNGYEDFGDNIHRILQRDFYAPSSLEALEAPEVRFAEISGPTEITLRMANVFDQLRWVAGSEAYFNFVGTSAYVVSGAIKGSRVVLSLANVNRGAEKIGFVGATFDPDPMVLNNNGMGVVHFFDLPITTPAQSDSSAVAAILKANGLAVSVASVVTRNAAGRVVALDLHGRGLGVLPRDIVFLDSLKDLNLGENRLSVLPREVTRLPSAVSVNLDVNYLCKVTDSIGYWITQHSRNASWRSTQNACSASEVTGREQARGLELVRVASFPGRVQLLFPRPDLVGRFEIYRMNGAVEYRGTAATSQVSLDVSGWARGLHVLRVETSDGPRLVRLPVL